LVISELAATERGEDLDDAPEGAKRVTEQASPLTDVRLPTSPAP
jgi:hypothetical protein